jgi:hypothetical protein
MEMIATADTITQPFLVKALDSQANTNPNPAAFSSA